MNINQKRARRLKKPIFLDFHYGFIGTFTRKEIVNPERGMIQVYFKPLNSIFKEVAYPEHIHHTNFTKDFTDHSHMRGTEDEYVIITKNSENKSDWLHKFLGSLEAVREELDQAKQKITVMDLQIKKQNIEIERYRKEEKKKHADYDEDRRTQRPPGVPDPFQNNMLTPNSIHEQNRSRW